MSRPLLEQSSRTSRSGENNAKGIEIIDPNNNIIDFNNRQGTANVQILLSAGFLFDYTPGIEACDH
jgi:hypothetical protein